MENSSIAELSMQKLRRSILWLFFIVYIVTFALLWVGALFDVDGNTGSGDPLLAAGVFTAYIAIWALIIRFVGKQAAYLARHKKVIVALVFCMVFLLQCALAYCFRFDGQWEMYYVNEAGMCLAEGNNLANIENGFYVQYFARYSNIRNTMLYIAQLFRFGRWLGVPFLRGGARVYTCLKSALAIPLMFYIAEARFGSKAGFYSVVFYCACLPVFLSAPVLYHITITFIYPLLLLFFYTVIIRSQKRAVKIACACLTAFVAALGIWIMKTPAIMLIAIAIEVFLLGNRKLKIMYTAILAAVLLLYVGGTHVADVYQEEHFYDPAYAGMRYPAEVFIYVGLNPEFVGYYSNSNRAITDAGDTVAERKAILRSAIKERLRQLGPTGVLMQLYKKSTAEFGTGAYSSEEFLIDTPTYESFPLRYFPSGEKAAYGAYLGIAQGIHLGLMLFVLLGAVGQCKDCGKAAETERKRFPAPWIALFGLLLATLFNETLPRHIYNYLPVMFICASYGVLQAERILTRAAKGKQTEENSAVMESGQRRD